MSTDNRLKKRLFILGIIIISLLISAVLLRYFVFVEENLYGAYTSGSQTISFDDNTFYYYYIDKEETQGNRQKCEKGFVEENDEGAYVMRSDQFQYEVIRIRDDLLVLAIDGVKHQFRRESDVPVFIDLGENK